MSYSFAAGNITQVDDSSQSISAVASGGTGLLDLTVTSSAAYSADDLAVVTGTTSYNGEYLIDSIPNGTTIRIPDTTVRGVQNAFGSTETGTVVLGDSLLDGLTGLTGVTKSTIAGKNFYSIASTTKFDVDGHICYNPENECLILEEGTAVIQCTVNDTFIAGRVTGTNADGSDRYTIGVGLITSTDGTAVNREVLSPGATGGEVIFYGAEVHLAAGIGVDTSSSGGTMDFFSSTLVNTSPTTFTHLGRSEGDANAISYYNCKFDGTNLAGNIFTKNGTNQLSGEFLNASLQNRFGTHDAAAIYEGLEFGKNFAPQDWVIFGNSSNDNAQAIEVTNCDIGTGIRPGFDVANRQGHLAVFQKININTIDTSKANIASAKIYLATTDNGNQVNSTRGDATGKFQNNRTFTTGLFDLYTATTDGSGQTGVLTVLTGRIWSDDGAETIERDLYSKTNTAGTDDYDVKYCSYLHNLKTTEFILKSEITLTPSDVLVTDILITETTKATVDAYTTIDDARELYDRAKAYLYDNFAGETATIVGRSGNQIEINGNNLIIDATAASVFAFSTPNVTIKSSTFTGGATATTGDVTIQNGTLLSGGTFNCDVKIDDNSDGDTYSNVTIDKLIHTGTGTVGITLSNSDVTEIEVTGGATLTVTLTNGSTVPGTLTETSGTITIVNNMTVTITGLTTGDTIRVQDNALVQQIYDTASGSSYQFTIDRADDGEVWKYAVDRAGYSPDVGTFTVAEGTSISIDVTLLEYKKAKGGTMYTATTSTDVTILFDLVTPQATIDVGNSEVTPQVIFDEFEVALLTADGMAWHAQQGSIVKHDSLPGVGDILFMGNDIRLRRELAGDVNAAVGGYVTSSDGTVVDGTNGGVAYIGGIDTADISASVWDYLTASATTSGSLGKLLVDNIDALISSRATPAQVATELSTYDGPTRAELTSDKNEIITEIDANETKIDAIKTKTDDLNYSISGNVDANIKYVNDIQVNGTGAEGNEWGPV